MSLLNREQSIQEVEQFILDLNPRTNFSGKTYRPERSIKLFTPEQSDLHPNEWIKIPQKCETLIQARLQVLPAQYLEQPELADGIELAIKRAIKLGILMGRGATIGTRMVSWALALESRAVLLRGHDERTAECLFQLAQEINGLAKPK